MPLLETAPAMLLLWAGLGYLLGSIPFGLVITWTFGMGDVRRIGSGNIGATNVLRTGNKLAAALTLILDVGKAAAAALIAGALAGGDAAQVAGFMAFVGHCYPVWLRFGGGKGVATLLGLLLALSPVVGAATCLTWLAGAALTRISSAAALISAALAPVWMALLGRGDMVGMGIVLAALTFWRHRGNIARLRAGTEPKIGKRKAD